MATKKPDDAAAPPAMETRAVLAGAYLRVRSWRSYLTHAVEVNEAGVEVKVLCDRVQLDSLADRCASDPTAPPTCPACLRRLGRL
jgi:hypothetical protein